MQSLQYDNVTDSMITAVVDVADVGIMYINVGMMGQSYLTGVSSEFVV